MELPAILRQDGCTVWIRDNTEHDFKIVINHPEEIEALNTMLPDFIKWFDIPNNRLTHSLVPEYTWDRYLMDVSPWSYF